MIPGLPSRVYQPAYDMRQMLLIGGMKPITSVLTPRLGDLILRISHRGTSPFA